jgi:hypothetical protein
MNLSMMRNEMEIFFRVFFISSCGFLVGRKRLVERLWREFFSDPSQWWDHRSAKVKRKKLETMMVVMMSGFRVLGFGLQQAARNVWLTS